MDGARHARPAGRPELFYPGTWHQPVFPTARSQVFDNAQGRVHACVSCDFLDEFGTYIEVGLALSPD